MNGVALDATRHSGGHEKYTKWVEGLIEKVSSNKGNAGKSATEILTGVAKTVKKTISNTKGKIDDLGK